MQLWYWFMSKKRSTYISSSSLRHSLTRPKLCNLPTYLKFLLFIPYGQLATLFTISFFLPNMSIYRYSIAWKNFFFVSLYLKRLSYLTLYLIVSTFSAYRLTKGLTQVCMPFPEMFIDIAYPLLNFIIQSIYKLMKKRIRFVFLPCKSLISSSRIIAFLLYFKQNTLLL